MLRFFFLCHIFIIRMNICIYQLFPHTKPGAVSQLDSQSTHSTFRSTFRVSDWIRAANTVTRDRQSTSDPPHQRFLR